MTSTQFHGIVLVFLGVLLFAIDSYIVFVNGGDYQATGLYALVGMGKAYWGGEWAGVAMYLTPFLTGVVAICPRRLNEKA